MQSSPQNKQKPLLRISNLKQYFPLKSKGLYVKANDGITLDIYEGETLGLVGESGCGKSTFGRTLLQLYKQTDGRTMYYGRSLYDLAPKYVEKTIKNLDKNKKKLAELEKKRDTLEKEYEAMPDGKEKYLKRNELDAARKQANDVFLDMTNLLGGFILAENTRPVIDAFSKVYKISARLRKENLALEEAELNLADAEFDQKKAKEEEKDSSSADSKVRNAKAKADEVRSRIEGIRKELSQAESEIDEMRKAYKDNSEFQRLEGFRDDGIDLARLNYEEIRLLRTDLQMIFQDPYSSLNPRMTVGQIISEGLFAHNYFKKSDERMTEYILKVMDDAGLQPYFVHRYPHQFSGGQRQRIGIARSLAVQPRFVVCDEAVSALDVSIQSQILNLLQDLKEQQHLTYLFITHDMSVVKYISNRIGVMYLGNLVELADSQEIFNHPLHPYTEALMNAIPTTDIEAGKEIQILEGDIPSPVNPPKGCKFHTRCKYCTEICEHQIPEWVEAAPNHFVACHHMLKY
ncbi:MAG: ATP-binding cassette domain-containing protein [Anaerolineaceae bacterium]|nr:ATP-binding cassette domain-containing protein [Anaerolineaceae bacterium]